MNMIPTTKTIVEGFNLIPQTRKKAGTEIKNMNSKEVLTRLSVLLA